ncbi:hypothetical protein ACFYY5_29220 [Nocardia elegans]|uniref:Uncharacterized protein n=1 Tax=Nocardia elegans TaxID=300029 RepID=A0ABW6TLG4_9NOCA
MSDHTRTIRYCDNCGGIDMCTCAPAPMRLAQFQSWLNWGERGLSSEAIVGKLSGAPIGHIGNHPFDPGDFRRCELLLREVPEAREHMHLLAAECPVWAALIGAWDELVTLAESEAPGVFSGRRGGRAPKTYARMQELFEEARGGVR